MKKAPLVLFALLALLLGTNACKTSQNAQQQEDLRPMKVACIGNSITYGSGIEDRQKNSYPAQLQEILGKNWQIKNFGISGATMVRNGDKPYWKQKAFDQSIAYLPDVVIIKLGTNDTKPQNWNAKQYETDYKAMIEIYQQLSSKPTIYICQPVPAYEKRWKIDPEIIDGQVLLLVERIAQDTHVELIDLYTPLSGKSELFPDKIHPNAKGAKQMAEHIAKILQKDEKKIRK